MFIVLNLIVVGCSIIVVVVAVTVGCSNGRRSIILMVLVVDE